MKQLSVLENLQQQFYYLKANSPYYQELFQIHGITEFNFSSLTEFEKIPTTSKTDFVNFNQKFLSVNPEKVIDYCTTSGTTGEPVYIALTEKDIERLAINEANTFKLAGVTAADTVQLMLTMDRQFMAGLAYYQGLRSIGAAVIRAGAVSPAMQWEQIFRFNPTVLVAVPSFILKLIDYADLHLISLQNSSVKKIICIGEPIRTAHFELTEIGKRILEKRQVKLFGTYASTEMQTAFSECEFGNGGHEQPNLIYTEILDENSKPVADGEFGEVTITTFRVEAMPLLRFKTGDICKFILGKCACGVSTRRLSSVVGRKNQLIKYKGTTLFPSSIFNILDSVNEIADYILVITKNELELEVLNLYILLKKGATISEENLTEILQSKLRIQIPLFFVNEVKLLELRPTDSRKLNHLIYK